MDGSNSTKTRAAPACEGWALHARENGGAMPEAPGRETAAGGRRGDTAQRAEGAIGNRAL